MSKKNRLLISFLPVLFFIASCTATKNTSAGASLKNSAASPELYSSIAHMDSVLFNAFNSRDVEKLKTLFTEDLEFYHDKDGLTGYSHTMESFIRTAAANNDLKRELIPGSLEVYPLKDFGAMQIGMHRFCHTENGKPDCGTFKFVHIWKKVGNEWKISRVISYGH
jgi:ketosteroid isomerase-like protein